jgi:alanine dehydrogenase
MTLLLNAREIQQVLTMNDAVSAMEDGFRDLASGNGINRPRSHTYVPRPSSPDEDRFYLFKSMDGALPRLGMHGIRMSSDMVLAHDVAGKRRREKVPAAPGGKYVGLLLLFSLDTLEPLAIMPDGYLQRIRVGATSAVAAKYLARGNVRRAAVIGTGWQAGAQVMGLCEVFPGLKELSVYSPDPAHRAAFAEEWSEKLHQRIAVANTAADAVGDADVVALATNSQVPVVEADAIPDGCHVGSLQGCEVPDALVARAGLVGVRERSEPTFWGAGRSAAERSLASAVDRTRRRRCAQGRHARRRHCGAASRPDLRASDHALHGRRRRWERGAGNAVRGDRRDDLSPRPRTGTGAGASDRVVPAG